MGTKAEAEAKFRTIVANKSGVVLGKYTGTDQKTRLRCSHGHEWEASPNNITSKNSTWCPVCAGQSPVVAEAKFRKVVSDKGGEVVGEYAGGHQKVRLRCSHDHEWEATPKNVKNSGSWCPVCHLLRRTNPHTEYQRDLVPSILTARIGQLETELQAMHADIAKILAAVSGQCQGANS